MTNNQERDLLYVVRDSLDATNVRLAAACDTSVTLTARKDALLRDVPEDDDLADAQRILDVAELQQKAENLSGIIQSQ